MFHENRSANWKPCKLSIAEAIALSPQVAKLIEAARTAEQTVWTNDTIHEVIEQTGLSEDIATVAVKRSRMTSTAIARALQIAEILADLQTANVQSND